MRLDHLKSRSEMEAEEYQRLDFAKRDSSKCEICKTLIGEGNRRFDGKCEKCRRKCNDCKRRVKLESSTQEKEVIETE
jgi:hypothetical protein